MSKGFVPLEKDMVQNQQSKAWIVLIVAILSTAGVICVALIVLGTPFANQLADRYFAPDEKTGLVLNFEGSFEGAQGEQGYPNGGAFVSGHSGQAAWFCDENTRSYFAANNISPHQGVIKFWLKPLWNGDEGQNYVFFEIGDTWFNRFRITKDGANNFGFMVWSSETEYDVACNVSDWIAMDWHQVIADWHKDYISLYLDGDLCDTETSVVMPDRLALRMYVGSSAEAERLPKARRASVALFGHFALGKASWEAQGRRVPNPII